MNNGLYNKVSWFLWEEINPDRPGFYHKIPRSDGASEFGRLMRLIKIDLEDWI